MHPFDARQLAFQLMQQHGLFAIGWRFTFDHARRRFGCCNYTRKLISLSRPLTLLNGEPEVRDTILHEIAHALCPPEEGHGPRWRSKCREIGAKPKRCYSDAAVVSPPRPPARYQYGCGRCGWWVERRRRPTARRRYVCAKCRGSLQYREKLGRDAGQTTP
jgi:predicted SprT family Zn-dependent metalloprotease